MAEQQEITAYTPGWWYFATPRELQTRAAAPYRPAFQLLYNTTRPFWIRVLGDRDVPRDWVERSLAGHTVGDVERGGLQVARKGPEMRFEMRDCMVWLPAEAVAAFLERTLVLVPFGAESIDWDQLTRGSAA